MLTEFRDNAGELVAEARMTGVETEENPEQRSATTDKRAPMLPAREALATPWASEQLALAPMQLGPVTRTDFVRYQGASGDMNPIHHDEPFAKGSGFSGPISVGMFQGGVMHAWAAAALGPENVRSVMIRWKEPVLPGDVLTFSAAVSKTYEQAGERRIDVDLACKKQNDNVAVVGSATYVVP
jgi:acyl dehydratase